MNQSRLEKTATSTIPPHLTEEGLNVVHVPIAYKVQYLRLLVADEDGFPAVS